MSDQAAPYVFLSYASSDQERCLQIADALKSHGVGVWVDRIGIVGGTNWSGEIVRAIQGCSALLVLCTRASMQSRNIQQEIQLAWDANRPIIPLLLERVDLPEEVRYALAGRQWIDLVDRTEDEWLPRVLHALAMIAGFGDGARSAGTTGAVPAAAGTEAAPRSARSGPIRLPAQTTRFIGRAEDLDRVRARLVDPDTRLLTVTGPGGIGKTRLSIGAARWASGEFPDGTFFVPLAQVRNAEDVIHTIANTFDVQEDAKHSALGALSAYLEKKQLLLVLDNFEQVIGAAPEIGMLLERCPGIKILATSRSLLSVYGEQVYLLGPMQTPDPQHLPPMTQLGEVEAVQLFVDRARAIRPDFALTPDNAATIAEICRRLDGLPLALELAAARIQLLSPDALLKHLDQSLRVLTGGAKSQPERQQTLRNAIAWSYNLLSGEEQALFRRLAVFARPFALPAIVAVCATDSIDEFQLLELLQSLVNNSLVLAEATSGEPSFRLLVTLREFGIEQLAVSDDRDVWEKAAAYFQSEADSAVRRHASVEAAANYDQALDVLEHLPGSLETRVRRVDTTIALCRESFVAQPSRNLARLREIEAIATTLPAPDGSAGNDLRRLAQVRYWLGRTYYYLQFLDPQNVPKALGYYQQVLAVADQLGDDELIAIPSSTLGGLLQQMGQYLQADPLLRRAVQLLEKAGPSPDLARALGLLAIGHAAAGHYADAIPIARRGLALADELQNLTLRGIQHLYAAMVHMYGGDWERMSDEALTSVRLATEAGETTMVGIGTNALAIAESRLGRTERALEHVHEIEALFGVTDSATIMAWKAEVLLQAGRFDEAAAVARDASRRAAEQGGLNNAAGEAEWVGGAALSSSPSGNWEEAQAHLGRSIETFDRGGCVVEAARVHRRWGELALRRGDPAALAQLLQAERLFQEFGLERELDGTRESIARANAGRSDVAHPDPT